MTDQQRAVVAIVERDNLISQLIFALEGAVGWAKSGKVIGEFALEEMEELIAEAKKGVTR